MMNNTVREAMTRLSRTSGADVTMISYPSDVSLGIGKAVWQFLEYGMDTIDQYETVSEKMTFPWKCYMPKGHNITKIILEMEQRVPEITQDIYHHRDTEAYEAL